MTVFETYFGKNPAVERLWAIVAERPTHIKIVSPESRESRKKLHDPLPPWPRNESLPKPTSSANPPTSFESTPTRPTSRWAELNTVQRC